jgi:glutaredoxin
MVVRIDLFTSVFCPHSKEASNLMKNMASRFRGEIDCNEIHIETSEGRKKARIIGVKATPTVVVDGRIAFVGVPSREDLVREITKRL